MAEKKKTDNDPGLMQTLGSLQFGIVILITIACVSIIGTILPQGQHPAFYEENFSGVTNFLITIFRFDITYRSPLFIGLLGLFGLNLVLCSVIKFPGLLRRTFSPDKMPSIAHVKALPVSVTLNGVSTDDVADAFAARKFPLSPSGENSFFGQKGVWGYLGAFTVHISLLLLLAGSLVSLLTGLRGHIILVDGEEADTAYVSETASFPLGFTVKLDRFDVEFYEEFGGRPKTFLSAVTVTREDGSTFTKDIKVNSPLMLNDFTVYQSSYGLAEDMAGITADNDTVTVSVRLKGAPETMPPIIGTSLTLGERIKVPGFGDSLSVELGEIHRDFKRGGGGGGGTNPAVRVDVYAGGERRWSVYAFLNFPGLNMPMYDDLPISFAMDSLSMAKTEETVEEEKYYTVLGVVRDRGIPLMWIGSAVMMLGLFLAFYLRPRRVWIVRDGDTVYIGGTSKGDTDGFSAFVRETVKPLRNKTN